ncbi:glycosyltransferase family 4 protein [Pelagicoccus sp. SDUM812003]|uniref:glycosyltransferase family 4 protein n=1 Tax=Pelagicoccus sp. SDUM812003 TaxID=3041267 RepID=UPI00280D47B4|nr:glycosyltransferase family 4 protein [Pelagicoccus sp. SDUM812003]MDQ8204993.1 glycosyltransferase family 4 protein [Pelagicoccus sp. SDUM812003]
MSRRILFISHSAARTGAPIGLLAFMRWVVENTDYKISTILKSTGPLESEFRELGPCLVLRTNSIFNNRIGRKIAKALPQSLTSQYRAVHSFLQGKNIDVIYSNTSTNGELLTELAKYGIPVLTHVHELSYWITQAGEKNWNETKKASSYYVAASHAVRDYIVEEKGIPSEQVSVVYEHIRELPEIPTPEKRQKARNELGISDEVILIGGCGSEYWRKGKDLIPQLLIELRKLRPDISFHFLWLGSNWSDHDEYTLSYDLKTAGFSSHFHNPGEVKDPFSLYAALDSFALLSRDDPYPLACLEVAAMQIPIVCFENSGGIPELTHRDAGLTAPYLDMAAFAQSLIKLTESTELRERITKNARINVDQESTLEATAPKLLEALEDAAKLDN